MRSLFGITLLVCACGPGNGGGDDLGAGVDMTAPATCTNGMRDGDETDVDCGGSCSPCADGKACKHAADCTDGICNNNVCAAPACNDGVKNGLETDVDCGGGACPTCAAGKKCLKGADCAGGTCTNNLCAGPVPDMTMVDLAMNDLATPGCMSDQMCGGLFHAHGKCVNMSCTVDFCDLNWADCDKVVANGCESDSLNDPNNCNFCGISCAVANGTGACNMGNCAIAACNPGFANCDNNFKSGCNVDTTSDNANCGGCGMVCALAGAQAQCVMGKCTLQACNMGFANCNANAMDGCEVDLQGDPNNCGKCGNVCPMNTPACVAGVCAVDDFPPIYLLYLLESP